MIKFKPIKISKPAQVDLKNIGNYTLENWGKIQKKNYLNLFKKSFIALSKQGSKEGYLPLVKNREEITEGLMSYPVKSHMVYFRETEYEIIIIRILHHRMEPSKHLELM